MKKKTSTTIYGNAKNAAKSIMRTLLLIAFGVGALFGITGGIYAYVAHSESEKSFVTYDVDNWPDSFPVLIAGAKDDGHSEAHIAFCYLSEDGTVDQQLYQIPGKGQVQIDPYDSGHYTVEAITATRYQVILNFWIGGGDGKVRYIYDIEDNHIRPQSYRLLAYFGWMFKALPLGLLATCIFLFICKQLYNLIGKKKAVRNRKLMP